jgi:hypothetical protein
MRVDVLEQALFAPSDEKWCRAMTPTVDLGGHNKNPTIEGRTIDLNLDDQ